MTGLLLCISIIHFFFADIPIYVEKLLDIHVKFIIDDDGKLVKKTTKREHSKGERE